MGNIITEKESPCAISTIRDFKVPKEKVGITSAFNYFNSWGESVGAAYEDY